LHVNPNGITKHLSEYESKPEEFKSLLNVLASVLMQTNSASELLAVMAGKVLTKHG